MELRLLLPTGAAPQAQVLMYVIERCQLGAQEQDAIAQPPRYSSNSRSPWRAPNLAELLARPAHQSRYFYEKLMGLPETVEV